MNDQDQQHADDVGAEIREHEWHDVALVPLNADLTDEQIVGALMAEAKAAIDDLAEPRHAAVLVNDERVGLAITARDIDKMILLLGTIRDEVAQALGNLMEVDTESIAGLAVTRTRSGDKTEWDKAGAWRAARANIIDRWVPAGTSEDLRKARMELIDRTLADVATAYSMTPQVKGLQAVGVNPYDYRAVTKGTRWAVKVS